MKLEETHRSPLYATLAAHESAVRRQSRDLSTETGSWSLKRAYGYCEQVARERSDNFEAAARFVPSGLRAHVWAIYAFARMADDFADDPSFEGERLAALDKWDELLEQAYRREVDHPVFRALRSTVRSFNIPIQLFKSLLTAYRMDLGLTQVLTYRELRGYCDRSASPIGRLALVIHGYWSPAQQRFSDDLCAGVQIANQLRNLRSDLAAGRCYLPLEDLMHFGVTREELAESTWTDGCRELIRFSASRTRTLLLRGQPLIRRVDADLGSELEVTWRGANAVLDQLGLQCSSETSQPNPAQGEPPVSSRFGFGALVGSLR